MKDKDQESRGSQGRAETSGGELPPATAVRLEEMVDYVPGSIVSRTIARSQAGTLTLFAFDRGQGLSEHSAPFDAHVVVLEGTADLVIGGQKVEAGAGQTVRMPANVPHAVQASTPFKMLLVMLRG